MGKVNQPSDLISEFRSLRQFVMELAKRVGLSSATISKGGLKIIDGGELVLVDENGTTIFRVGQIEWGAGTSFGVRMNWDDGGAAILLGGDPNAQAWALFDHNANHLVTNDAVTGYGLARPFLNYRLVPSLSAQSFGSGDGSLWPSTASTSLIALLEGTNPICHPRMSYRVAVTTDGTGDVAWEIRFGSAVAASGTGIGSGIVDTPGWGSTILPWQDVNITVHARVTGASTRGWIQVTRCYGTES